MWLERLRELLSRIKDGRPALESLTEWVVKRYGTKPVWTGNSLRVVLLYAGLAEMSNHNLTLSDQGARFLESGDPEVVLDAIIDRIWGVREILFWLKDGATTARQLLNRCVEYGAAWRRPLQVAYRLQWLTLLGAVKRAQGYYALTRLGLRKVEEMAGRRLMPEPLPGALPAEAAAKAVKEAPKPAEPPTAPVEAMPGHGPLQDALVELGRLEGYEADKEYRINDERLDAAWWRKGRRRPDVAFEVQRAGDFYAALIKLKEAWDLWECKVVLVTSDEYLADAERWLKGAFHEMEAYSRIALWKEVMEWLKASRVRNGMKRKLGINPGSSL